MKNHRWSVNVGTAAREMDSRVLSGSNTQGGWKLSHASLPGDSRPPHPTFRSANAGANRNLDDEMIGRSPSEGPFVALECVLIPVALAIWWFWFRGSGRKGPATATINSGLLTNGAGGEDLDNASAVSSSNDSRTSARPSASDDAEEVASGYEIMKCRTAGAEQPETASSAVLVVRDQARTTRWLPAVRSYMMKRFMAPAFVQQKETNKLHSPRSIPVDGSSIVSEFRRISKPNSPAETRISATSTLAATKVVSLPPCEMA
jgi:hypothetical protein